MPSSTHASPTLSVPAGWRLPASEGQPRVRRNTARRAWLRNRGAALGAVVLIVLVVVAIAAPRVVGYDPIEQNLRARLEPPGPAHLMGTDNLGRDIFSRVVYGARISLRIGFISIGIASLAGLALGLPAGFYGGRIESIIMRLMDVMLAFPGILLALIVISLLGSSLTNVMIAVGVGGIPPFTRLVRGSVLSTRGNLYVEAARVVGCRDVRIVLRHILPNMLAPLIVFATLGVASAILSGAALSFLGLGVQPPEPEWGLMLADGRGYLRGYWWMATFPGLAIMLATLAINMLGDGLRDVMDPRLRRI
jgi:peptide/nickel transport system permease protein